MLLIIIMQFGFGVAAGAIASGSAPELAGPMMGVLSDNYRFFDWQMLEGFFPSACHAASANLTTSILFEPFNMTFHFPACGFAKGSCSSEPPATRAPQETTCCKGGSCDTSRVDCLNGETCVTNLLGRIAAP
jgi:hypothetical protein